MGLNKTILNVGEVEQYDIRELYTNVDALLLPTLLESFSSTYADAMFYRKPIFTSDRDFAHEACGKAAIYFNPNDVDDIYEKIDNAFNDQTLIEQKVIKGSERINQLPDWSKITDMYINGLENMFKNGLS